MYRPSYWVIVWIKRFTMPLCSTWIWAKEESFRNTTQVLAYPKTNGNTMSKTCIPCHLEYLSSLLEGILRWAFSIPANSTFMPGMMQYFWNREHWIEPSKYWNVHGTKHARDDQQAVWFFRWGLRGHVLEHTVLQILWDFYEEVVRWLEGEYRVKIWNRC